jgi:hypothetical protein
MGDPLSLQAAVLCEDIRAEINNKYTLIGVFGLDINLATLPGALNLAIYMEHHTHQVGHFDGEMRLLDPEDSPLLSINFTMDIDRVGGMLMPIGPFPVRLKTAGIHRFQIRFSADWIAIKNFSVNLDESLRANARPGSIQGATTHDAVAD